jgi:hypothetical protein
LAAAQAAGGTGMRRIPTWLFPCALEDFDNPVR